MLDLICCNPACVLASVCVCAHTCLHVRVCVSTSVLNEGYTLPSTPRSPDYL